MRGEESRHWSPSSQIIQLCREPGRQYCSLEATASSEIDISFSYTRLLTVEDGLVVEGRLAMPRLSEFSEKVLVGCLNKIESCRTS